MIWPWRAEGALGGVKLEAVHLLEPMLRRNGGLYKATRRMWVGACG